MNVLVINGPNLNLLGLREPQVYGTETLSDVSAALDKTAAALGVQVEHFQHNCEGDIVSRIHDAMGNTDWIIINAGAYTHTSIAIRDALAATRIPFVEVHISNVHAREAFRRHSHLSDLARGVIVGLGTFGYQAALQFIARQAEK